MIYSVIMAGGIGTRFWPLSRKDKPKQFLSIINKTSLLDDTIHRLESIIPTSHHTIVSTTALKHAFPNDLLSKATLFWEPEGKNTAPCIGWVATLLHKQDPDALLVIVPSDHWVSSIPNFEQTIQEGIDEATHNNTIVTIGIIPTSPHTGYGYIEVEAKESTLKHVKSFTEKPDVNTATHYLKKGNYYWNSGMFIMKASTLLNQFKIHLPSHYDILTQLALIDKDSPEVTRLYNSFDPISIDYGIMEKSASLIRLIPAYFDWNDIGNWTALEQFLEKDATHNAHNGPLVSIDSSHNIIYSPQKLVALSNVHNMIIVNTDDALLLLPKEYDQNIKKIYENLPSDYK